MKKRLVVIFFSFILMFLLGGVTSKVGASNFWETIGNYEIEEAGGENYYHFENQGGNFNFIFDYGYKIEAENPIQDGYNKIYHFYGVHKEPTINYVDLPKPGLFIEKDDRMVIYRYDYAAKDFNSVVNTNQCAPNVNEEGVCSLNQKGLYKIVTDGVSGATPVVYLFYEPDLYSMIVNSVEFFNFKMGRDYPSLEVKTTIKDPRHVSGIETCVVELIEYNDLSTLEVNFSQTVSASECKVNGSDGEYEVEMVVDMRKVTQKVGADVIVIVYVAGTQQIANQTFNYDMVTPIIKDIRYYNSLLDLKGFSKEYVENVPLVLPGVDEGVLVEITIFDDNELLTDEILINNNACDLPFGIGIKEIEEAEHYILKCIISKDMYEDITSNGITYSISDVYGNKNVIIHESVSFDYNLIHEGENFEEHINVENGIITANFDPATYPDINKVCLFYGGDDWKENFTYQCGNRQVESIYTYIGDIQILVFNEALMFDLLTIRDVHFTNGYDASEFVINKNMTLDDYEQDLTTDLTTLIHAACFGLSVCEDDRHSYFLLQIDDSEPELLDISVENFQESGNISLNFLKMLNDKLRNPSAALEANNVQVKIIFEYPVGSTKQRVMMTYNFTDNLPNIVDEISLDDVKLEYKNFDITSKSVIKLLYGDDLLVTLKDNNDISYSGKIVPRFVAYKDRAGNVSAIDNKSYTYIGEQTAFGYYTLECRVKLLRDLTNDVVYDDDIYVKSFFVNVELKDSIIPTLTLLGDKEVNVKQFDVYKDAGTKCSDLSGCEVKVTYYLNSEDNQVEKIDTAVTGKYI